MPNFLYKIQEFMRGRYGFDTLNGALLALSIILNLVSRFVFNFYARMILQLISLIFVGLCVFRFLSRNCAQREKENNIYKRFSIEVANPPA